MERIHKFINLFIWIQVLGLITAEVLHDCPTGWVEFNGHCYHFVFYPQYVHSQASKACQVDGAYLVSVNTIQEYNFVSGWLTNNDQNRANIWWTSGVGQDTDLIWEGDGTQISSTSDMWLHHEEQNSIEHGNHIVFLYSVVAGKFMYGRQRAGVQSRYVCEISLLEAYRIIQQDRDHLFGTNITDPNDVLLGPKFIVQPQTLVVLEPMEEISIECVATGKPHATYTWYRVTDSGETTLVSSSDRYTLTNGKLTMFNPTMLKDKGNYQCVARNHLGTTLSRPARINFGYLLEFSNDPPGAVTALMYQGTVMSCLLPAYNPSVSIKWYKEDGGPNFMRTDLQQYIMVSNNGKLYFSETSRVDSGYYHCFVTLASPVGQLLSSAQLPSRTSLGIQLIVTGEMALDYGPEIHDDFPAVFPMPPLRGETLTLECFAYGRLPMKYTWFRNGGPVPAKAQYLEHNRWLVLPDAQFEDGGNYTCRVERSSSASQEKTLHLRIEARPLFVFPLKDQHVDLNRQFTWRCEALAVPAPTYTWFKDGKPLTSIPGDIEVRTNALTILKADPKHEGMYQCRAVNAHGTTFTTAQLRVLSFAPTFIKNPLNPSQFGTAGGLVTILCQPEAAPLPDITWKKDGRILPLSEGVDGRVTQLSNGNLLIRDLQIGDQGTYECTATNSQGSASSSGKLIVLTRTVINVVPSDTQVDVNSTAFLACQASFDERTKDLVYVWDLNGKIINYDIEPHYTKGTQSALPGLYIVNAQVYHTGRYTCSATTVDYVTSQSAFLEVRGPPGECAGARALVIGDNVTLTWVRGPAHGAPISRFHIQFNTNFNSIWRTLLENVRLADVIDTNGMRERLRLVLSGLKPGSSYRFRVIAINRYGMGPPSMPTPLYKMPDAAPIVPVSGIRAAWGPVGTLPIVWDHLSEEDLTGSGVGYTLYWRLKDASNAESKWSVKVIEGRVNHYTPLVGADNYYLPYDIMVAAFNDLGSGPNSTIQMVMSAEDMPVAASEKVYGDGYNGTAMMVYWKPIPNTREYIRGKIMGYQVNYWPMSIPIPEIGSTNVYCDDCGEGMVIGLDPNEDYWINVQVFTAAGLGPVSGDGEGSTFIFPPLNYPEFVHVGSFAGNAVFVHWRGISTGLLEESLIGYKIRWWPATENIRKANDTVIPEKMNHGVVHGVQEGVVYALRVLGYSAGGDGKKSPTVYFTLEGEVMINPETTEIMNSSPSLHQLDISYFFVFLIFAVFLFSDVL